MELTYRREGNYLIPNLYLDQSQEAPGKYGLLRKRFLKEHQRGIYTGMLLNGTLQGHLLEIDRIAHEQVEQTMDTMTKTEGVTEALKARDQMAWVARMNSIKQRAEEVVFRELIYV